MSTSSTIPPYEFTASSTSSSPSSPLLGGGFVSVQASSESRNSTPSTSPSKTKSFFNNLISRNSRRSPNPDFSPSRFPPSPVESALGSPRIASSPVPPRHSRANSLPDLDNSFLFPSTLPLARAVTSEESITLPPEIPPTLESIGLELTALTPLLPTRTVLCGAILDNYLLIGTSNGLYFLPLSSVLAKEGEAIGGSKSKKSKIVPTKPISLIKRTRFRELAVLDKRSNILLAVAGKNYHCRVYALDGIRSMIEVKLAQSERPILSDINFARSEVKGKSKAPSPIVIPPSVPHSSFPLSPPPDYSPLYGRRGSQFSTTSPFGPPSPRTVRAISSHSINGSRPSTARNHSISGSGSIGRTLRSSKSREFAVGGARRTGSSSGVRKQSRTEGNVRRGSESVGSGKALEEWSSDHGSPVMTRTFQARPASTLMARNELRLGAEEPNLDLGASPGSSTAMTRSLSLSEFLGEVDTGIGRDPLETQDQNIIPPRTSLLDLDLDDNKPLASISGRLEPRASTHRNNEENIPISSPLPSSSSTLSLPTSSPSQSRRWSNGVSALFNRSNAQQFNPIEVLPTQASPIQAARPSPTVLSREREKSRRNRSSEEFSSSSLAIPASSTIPSFDQDHPANAASPLEYVKLARTKGTCMMRAVETKKSTYLAVVVGEEHDRIELFTGKKSISLSLNRTFVLPAAPVNISLQIQGDDLVDCYLIYNDSIFGLEPNSVRIREVGVGRTERRRRRRDTADAQSSTPITPVPVDTEDDPFLVRNSTSTPNSVSVDSPPPRVDASSPPAPPRVDSNSPSPPRVKDETIKYSTFQQLRFVPPVPASVLAKSWTIPPLYESVSPDASLLSPISLLAQSGGGSPALFYVSNGDGNLSIVGSDGRLVIKSPINLNREKSIYSDFEIILLEGGKSSAIVGMGLKELKVVKVDAELGFLPAIEVKPMERKEEERELIFLGMGGGGFIYSEKNSSGWRIYCLAGKV